MRRFFLFVLGFAVVGFVAARLFWPERWAINTPLGYILGRPRKVGEDRVLARLRAPEGFHIARFAADLGNVRMLRVTPEGDLLASQSREGKVLLVRADANGDGRSDGVTTLMDGLDRPHGLDLHDGFLYVAESSGVSRVRFDPAARAMSGDKEPVVTGLPAGGNHWSRTLRFGPDGGLYVSIGSSCNVCIEEDRRRAAIVRYAADGTGEELYGTGLRNAVGFDWHPETGELYATDNGRDLLGDDFPPCELNRVVRGGFYGWPFASGDRVPDPDLGKGHEADVARSIAPVHAFRPHNAPLGITFLRRPPAGAYRSAALVALHGSWNRTSKDGYKVVSLHWGAEGRITERDFVTGFLEREDVIGRPVDIAEGKDGAIYISDDYGGSIYRVAAGEGGASAAGGTPPASAAASAPPAPEAVERGRALYARHDCALCHEAKRPRGGVLARPLVRLGERYTIESLVDFLRTPTPPMPVPPLDGAERRDLAAFLIAETAAR